MADALLIAAGAGVPGGSHSPLLVLAIVLLAGVVFGTLAKRVRLPSVTGQILVGVAIGPVLGLFDASDAARLHPVTEFALGIIAMTVGAHLNVVRLRNAFRRILTMAVFEVVVTPTVVVLAVVFLTGESWEVAVLLGALAISTAPATVVAIVKETRAKGVFVKTLVAAVALNNITCLAAFEIAHAVSRVSLDPARSHDVVALFVAPGRAMLGSAVIGAACGVALVVATRRVVRLDVLTSASIIAVLFAVGLAQQLGLSPILAALFLGITQANLTPGKEEVNAKAFESIDRVIIAAFFTLAGMHLEFSHLGEAGLVAAVVVAARFAGKVVSGHVAMRVAGATENVRRWLGAALVPQAGIAVGLILLIDEDPLFGGIGQFFLAVGLSVVTINEIVGPLLTRTGLVRSGDAGKDRPRLLDFLREENIVVGFEADTKEEAYAKLARIVVRANHLPIDHEAFLERVLERERVFSTCVGWGLAIPHGILDEGDEITGAMGLSERGLPFETPDGEPVRCIVMLATPESQRDHHQQVLAGIARLVTSDELLANELFTSGTAAHAYEVLHAHDDAEDLNYFLDEEDDA